YGIGDTFRLVKRVFAAPGTHPGGLISPWVECAMAFADLRAYLEVLAAEGELARVPTAVDWDLELGALSRRAMDLEARAPLFENLTGYPGGSGRVLANIFGKTPGVPGGRFALALGLPKDIPTTDLIAEFGRRSQQRIPPRRVTTAPCKQNILVGDAVD